MPELDCVDVDDLLLVANVETMKEAAARNDNLRVRLRHFVPSEVAEKWKACEVGAYCSVGACHLTMRDLRYRLLASGPRAIRLARKADGMRRRLWQISIPYGGWRFKKVAECDLKKIKQEDLPDIFFHPELSDLNWIGGFDFAVSGRDGDFDSDTWIVTARLLVDAPLNLDGRGIVTRLRTRAGVRQALVLDPVRAFLDLYPVTFRQTIWCEKDGRRTSYSAPLGDHFGDELHVYLAGLPRHRRLTLRNFTWSKGMLVPKASE